MALSVSSAHDERHPSSMAGPAQGSPRPGLPVDPARTHQHDAVERAQPGAARDLLGWPKLFAPAMPAECRPIVAQLRKPLAQDRLDTFHLNEICVCCQGTALDLDELLGMVLTLAGQGRSLGVDLALRGVAALPGAYYGYQNYRGGVQTGRALKQLAGAVQEDRVSLAELARQRPPVKTLASPPPDLGPVLGAERTVTAWMRAQPHTNAELGAILRERELNLSAQHRNIELSRSLQRFIRLFDGAVPMLSALLTVAAGFVPVLGAVAGALLVGYCFAHALRYAAWDLSETLKRSSGPLPAPARDSWLARGEAAFSQLQRHRIFVLGATIAAFVAYGGAAIAVLAAAVGVGGAAFETASLVSFMAAMGAVLVLNNGPVKDIYGKNSKDRLPRYDLGSEEQIVSLLGRAQSELSALKTLEGDSRRMPRDAFAQVTALTRELAVLGLVTLGYITATLGLTGLAANSGHSHHDGHDHVSAEDAELRGEKTGLSKESVDDGEQGACKQAHTCAHDHKHDHGPHAHPSPRGGVGGVIERNSLALEGWMARTLHGLRAEAVRTSPARSAALADAVTTIENIVRQPDPSKTLPYDVAADGSPHARLAALLGHLKLYDRVAAQARSLAAPNDTARFAQEFETAAIMALVHERRPELRFAQGALADHLHARRRIDAGASF